MPYQEERLRQIRNLKLEDRKSAGIPEDGFPEKYHAGMFVDMTPAKRSASICIYVNVC